MIATNWPGPLSAPSNPLIHFSPTFSEYTQKVEQAIWWESQVNKNNAACYNNTRDAFEYIRTAVYTESGRNELNRVFNVQPPLGSNMSTIDFDSTNFFANLIGIINVIDQYSFDDRGPSTINSSGLNIANFCGFMIDPKANHTERLYNVYAWYYSWNGYSPPPPFDNDYWGDMDYFRDVSFQSGGAAYRGWMWLLCNEFGWLPTTDFGYGIFQNLVPLSYYMKYCQDIFDTTINNDYIETNIAATFQKYGLPSNYNGSNVVLPNGSLDGWGTIGCNVSDDAVHRKVRTTIGGAHCVDMYPYTQNTPGSVENSDVINTINLVKQESYIIKYWKNYELNKCYYKNRTDFGKYYSKNRADFGP
uniref:Uncharacterized protein n=1 Tax=Acrobeloides nanus TaxID=290746 RepID=A0A914E1T2_9BILA